MTKWQTVFDGLKALYDEIDQQAAVLEAHHADRLQCGEGCCDCCVDGLTVFEVEAEHIRQSAGDVLSQNAHGEGKCAFLDAQGACRIYALRPYVCRTQGLPLRWFDVDEDEGPVELRDICPLNENEIPLEILPPEVCWEIGPYEGHLAALQAQINGGKMKRVILRDLFEKERDGAEQ